MSENNLDQLPQLKERIEENQKQRAIDLARVNQSVATDILIQAGAEIPNEVRDKSLDIAGARAGAKYEETREVPPTPELTQSSTIPDMVENNELSNIPEIIIGDVKVDDKPVSGRPKSEDVIDAQEMSLVVQNEIPLSPTAKENISKLKQVLDKPGWDDIVDSETGIVTSQALVIEPVLKQYASQVQIAVDTKQGFGMVDTAQITHKPPSHKDETSTVVATVSVERKDGQEIGGSNKWEKSQYLANGDIVTTTHFTDDLDGKGEKYVKILYKNESPELLRELVEKNSTGKLYPNEAAITTHFQKAIDDFKEKNLDVIQGIVDRYPDNPEEAKQIIVTTIASRTSWDKTIPDEDKVVLGYTANRELAKKSV